jgi:hypothetical protein
MLEAHLGRVFTEDPRGESAAATRERLKGAFPPGATRRMTTLGMLVGSVLGRLDPDAQDAIVYATGYAESCALEGYLDGFPAPSPTLFQTSIHPSAVQQLMIGRQRGVRELMPLSGGALLAFHAVRACLLSASERVLLCGGEERGTWLLEHGLASDRTFAFAASLGRVRTPESVGTVRLSPCAGAGALDLAGLFDVMRGREPFDAPVAPGWRLSLEWR